MSDFASAAAVTHACDHDTPRCRFNLLPALLALPADPEPDLSLLQWLDARIGGSPSEPYFAGEPWPEPSEPAQFPVRRRRFADLGRW